MKNKRINSFFKIDKKWVKIKTWQYGYSSHTYDG